MSSFILHEKIKCKLRMHIYVDDIIIYGGTENH